MLSKAWTRHPVLSGAVAMAKPFVLTLLRPHQVTGATEARQAPT